jgi:cell division protein FtsL
MECVKLGYEIYNLSQEIERKKLQLQDVTEIHDEIMQPEKLYKAAKDLDMHFPEPDRVYYVE